MTSKADYDKHARLNALEREFWDTENINRLPVYQSENIYHYLAKAAFAFHLYTRKSGFIGEAEHPDRGIADIIDPNPNEPVSHVYELETGYTKGVALEKATQYGAFDDRSIIGDVFTVDISSVDDETTLGELKAMANAEIV